MENPELKGFQARLKDLIGSDSVSRFAADCGLGDNLVRKYLEGATPGLDKAVRIAKAKGCNLLWLAEGRGPMYGDAPRGTAEEQAAYRATLARDDEFVEIPHFNVKASAGLGLDGDDEVPTHFNKYRRDFWMRKIHADPAKCFTMDVDGVSMVDKLFPTDRPIVDRSLVEILSDAIYVFRYDGRVFVKNIDRVPGRGLVARSENPSYPPWDIIENADKEFMVIGRVIWRDPEGERL